MNGQIGLHFGIHPGSAGPHDNDLMPPRTPPMRAPSLDAALLEGFHPAVAAWFRRTFPAPTQAQAEAWPAIRSGRNTLVAAPTGSGKTLTAFLSAIDARVREGLAHEIGRAQGRGRGWQVV